MANGNYYTGDRTTKRVRWIARGIGSFSGALFLLIGILRSLEGAMLAGLVIIVMLGVLIAWRWEGIGGTVMVVGAIIALGTFAYVTAGHNKVWAMLMTSVPFLVPGILFLAYWWRSRSDS